MEEGLISILIPAYNAEKYIGDAIQSVLNQTYGNFELVILDDGSTDKTLGIVQEYQKMDSRIRVYSIENGGLSHARNELVSLAKGEYIAFLDADDRLDERFVEITYKKAMEEEADVVICQYSKYDLEKGVYRFFNAEQEQACFDFKEAYGKMYKSANNMNRLLVVAWAKLVKASLYENIYYPNGKAFEDSYTTYKLMMKANKIVSISDKLYIYSVTPGSLSSKRATKEIIHDSVEQHEERITLLTLSGVEISKDNITDYIATLKGWREYSYKNGFEDEYKWINQKIDLIENYSQKR